MRRHHNLSTLSTSLFIQAAITTLFGMAPVGSTGGGWQVLQFGLGAGAAGVGIALRTPGARARTLVLAFEAVAVAIGAFALMSAHVYIPGTIVGIGVLIRAASLGSDAGMATPPAPQPYGTPPAPQPYGTPPAPQPYGTPPVSSGYAAAPGYGAAWPDPNQPWMPGAGTEHAPAPAPDADTG